jgi:hypothetical protein
MNTNGAALVILAAAMGAAGAVSTGTQFTGATATQLHALACKTPAPSDNPWNIRNLYDCDTSTLYIPAQLRTGAAWDGAKTRERLAAAKTCRFPAGPGWALSVRRTCTDTAVEITSIRLNGRDELESIEFNAWRGKLSKDGYRYAPGKGMTAAWGY